MWTNSIVYNFRAIFFVYFNTSWCNLLHILLGWIRISIFKLLDPDPHWEEQLDPDPQKMNADPQPWFVGCDLPSSTLKNGSPS